VILLLALFAAADAMSGPALAQWQGLTLANPITNPDASVTQAIPLFNPPGGVLNRPRPDYDTIGLRRGNLALRPSLTAGGLYFGNVFNSRLKQVSDVAFEFTPGLRLDSNMPRHAFNAAVSSRTLFFRHNTSEDRTDVSAQMAGRYDIGNATNVTLDGGYMIFHEVRGTPDLPGNAANPTQFAIGTTRLALNHRFNRLQTQAGVSYLRLDYRDTQLVPPGPAIRDNSDRNRNIVTVYGQAGYEFSPGYLGFLRGSYNTRSYDLKVDNANFARDSNGFEFNGGAQFELSRLLVGQLYAGYLQQTFDDTRFARAAGPAFGGAMQWFPTELTTVRFNTRRSVEETIIFGASSYTATRFGVGVDHELLRNLIVSADAVLDNNRYNNTPRTDRFWGVSLGAAYLMNRNVQLNASYVLAHRDSNLAGLGFTNNILRVGVVGGL
jgi:hypothetical protein